MSEHNSFIKSTQEKDERLEALKKLYPEIFSDGKINLDAFKDATNTSDLPEGQDKTPGYYGLYWPGKRNAKQLARKEAEGTLEQAAGDGVDEENTHNLYIEGDNLEVLRILKKSYKSRIKMIYIDPPYNTGSDFIYPDDYKMPVEEYLKMTGQADESGKKQTSNPKSSGAFHTNWLNMMYPRLQLARELLTEDGVIFISIDDNEQANLKLLCDDVFGEENFVNCICVKSRASISNDKVISPNHNFILFYAKDLQKVEENRKLIGLDPNLDGFNLDDNDGRGGYRFVPVDGPGGAKKGNPYYEFQGITGYWRFSKETMQEKFDKGLVVKKGNSLAQKYYKSTAEQTRRTTTTWWDDVGLNSSATANLKTLMENTTFDTPKPLEIIERMLQMITHYDKNSIILDFFSGSATTAHAVMQLNAQDKGNRKFIMVQLPHLTEESSEAFKAGYKNICEIGKERIRRAGKLIIENAKSASKNGKSAIDNEENNLFAEESSTKNSQLSTVNSKLDVGFKVYRLTKSNFRSYTPVQGQDEAAKDTLFKELEGSLVPLVDGWKAENVITQIILREGFALDCTKEKLSSISKNTVYKITDSFDAVRRSTILYVCLDTHIEEETIKSLTLGEGEKFICLDSAIDDSSYARLSDKGRIETI